MKSILGKYALPIKVIAFILYSWFLWGTAQDSIVNAVNTKALEEVQLAVEKERAKQGKVNAIAKKQAEDLTAINAKLADDISRLHEREDRRSKPKTAKSRCSGSSGATLSRQDAGFLTRETARCDKIRTGLAACYDYADVCEVASD